MSSSEIISFAKELGPYGGIVTLVFLLFKLGPLTFVLASPFEQNLFSKEKRFIYRVVWYLLSVFIIDILIVILTELISPIPYFEVVVIFWFGWIVINYIIITIFINFRVK
ncbi:hypothetical protein NW801_12575, partial [Brevibacillus laterosporus]